MSDTCGSERSRAELWNTFGVQPIDKSLTRGAPLRGDPWLLDATASRYYAADVSGLLNGEHSSPIISKFIQQ